MATIMSNESYKAGPRSVHKTVAPLCPPGGSTPLCKLGNFELRRASQSNSLQSP